ncbi:MAG: hypothetical protein AAF206_26430 [Bacteroidota bacterium]
MRKPTLARSVLVAAMLGIGSFAMAQSPAVHAGKMPVDQQQTATTVRPYQKATKVEVAKKAVVKEGQLSQNAKSTVLTLVSEMKANQNNAAYDMKAAVLRLQQSPYVMYTLSHFDPTFPIVFRTGDAKIDQQNYNKAKAAWKATQR